ncbi:MAG: hypothetical protein GY724_30395, partial [Actinomycetia bacterium]|nr:hypothetical protein [Actinomycetes bacterium]
MSLNRDQEARPMARTGNAPSRGMKMLRMIDRATRSFGTVLALIVGIYLIAQTFASSTGATLGISMLLIVGSAITLRGAGLS